MPVPSGDGFRTCHGVEHRLLRGLGCGTEGEVDMVFVEHGEGDQGRRFVVAETVRRGEGEGDFTAAAADEGPGPGDANGRPAGDPVALREGMSWRSRRDGPARPGAVDFPDGGPMCPSPGGPQLAVVGEDETPG